MSDTKPFIFVYCWILWPSSLQQLLQRSEQHQGFILFYTCTECNPCVWHNSQTNVQYVILHRGNVWGQSERDLPLHKGGSFFFCRIEFPQLIHLSNCDLGKATRENIPSTCFGFTMAGSTILHFAIPTITLLPVSTALCTSNNHGG